MSDGQKWVCVDIVMKVTLTASTPPGGAVYEVARVRVSSGNVEHDSAVIDGMMDSIPLLRHALSVVLNIPENTIRIRLAPDLSTMRLE